MVLTLDLLYLNMKGRWTSWVVRTLIIFKNGILLKLRLMESLVTTAELVMLIQMSCQMETQIFQVHKSSYCSCIGSWVFLCSGCKSG